MFMSIKIKYGININNVGVTNYDQEDDLNSFLGRVHKFLMQSKLSKNVDIYYGTRYFNYSHSGSFDNLKSIFTQSPTLNVYGFYKEMPLLNKVEIIESKDNLIQVRSPQEYLSFMKKQEYVYLEHPMIPDILRADIFNIDYSSHMIEMTNMKFLDNSPVHRKNIRITPHKPLQAAMTYENELLIQGLVADISKNSILFTTQLHKIEEIQVKGLQTKVFTVKFQLDGMANTIQTLEMKAMIYKVFGNQVVLNIYPTLEVQNIILEYISMCQKLLLLEIQGTIA